MKKTTIKIGVCLICSLMLCLSGATQSRKDSLKRALVSYQGIDTAYVDLLYLLAFEYNRSDSDSMRILCLEVLELSDSLHYGAGLVKGNRSLCNYYEDIYDPSQAIEYGERALHIADSIHRPLLKAQVLNNLANLYAQTDPKKAVTYLLEALPLFQQAGNQRWEAIGLQTLGNLYRELANWEQSIETHEAAMGLFEEIGEAFPEGVPGQYVNLGTTYKVKGELQADSSLALQDFERAVAYMEKAVIAFEKINHPFGSAVTAVNLGTVWKLMGKYLSAIAAYEQALGFNEKVGHQGIDYLARWGKIDVMQRLGYFAEAEVQALRLRDEKKEIMSSDNFSDLYETLYACAMGLEDYETAYGYIQQKIAAEREQDWNSQLKDQLAEITGAYEADRLEAERLIIAQNQQRIQLYQFFLIVLGLILAMVGSIWLWQTHLIRVRQRQTQAEKESVLELEKTLMAIRLEQAKKEKQELEEVILLKNQLLSSRALQLAQKNEWLRIVHSQLEANPAALSIAQLIQSGLDQDRNWQELRRLFEEVHPGFFTNLKGRFPSLSKADLRLAAFYRMGLSKAEILQFLAIAPDSLKMSRYRLRKNMGLNQEEDLLEILSRF